MYNWYWNVLHVELWMFTWYQKNLSYFQYFQFIMMSYWLASWRCYFLWLWMPTSKGNLGSSTKFRTACQLWYLKQCRWFYTLYPMCNLRSTAIVLKLKYSMFLRKQLLVLQNGYKSWPDCLIVGQEKLHGALPHLLLADWLCRIVNSLSWKLLRSRCPFGKIQVWSHRSTSQV